MQLNDTRTRTARRESDQPGVRLRALSMALIVGFGIAGCSGNDAPTKKSPPSSSTSSSTSAASSTPISDKALKAKLLEAKDLQPLGKFNAVGAPTIVTAAEIARTAAQGDAGVEPKKCADLAKDVAATQQKSASVTFTKEKASGNIIQNVSELKPGDSYLSAQRTLIDQCGKVTSDSPEGRVSSTLELLASPADAPDALAYEAKTTSGGVKSVSRYLVSERDGVVYSMGSGFVEDPLPMSDLAAAFSTALGK